MGLGCFSFVRAKERSQTSGHTTATESGHALPVGSPTELRRLGNSESWIRRPRSHSTYKSLEMIVLKLSLIYLGKRELRRLR